MIMSSGVCPNGQNFHCHKSSSSSSSNHRKPAPQTKPPAPTKFSTLQHSLAKPSGQRPATSFGHSGNLPIALPHSKPVDFASMPRTKSSLGLYYSNTNSHLHARPRPPSSTAAGVYAPASVASPQELHYRQPTTLAGSMSSLRLPPPDTSELLDNFRQNSASTKVAVDEQRPRRPSSALGGFFERFGSLRRKRRSRKPNATPSEQIYGARDSLRPSTAGPEVNGTQQGANDDDNDREAKLPEADKIYAEGLRALDGNCERRPAPTLADLLADETLLGEGEQRTLLLAADNNAKFRQLAKCLVNWLNDELADERLIVASLLDDLHDGQVLCKLLERLDGCRLDALEVTQNADNQRARLRLVLDHVNRLLLSAQAAAAAAALTTTAAAASANKQTQIRWTVDGIHSRNLIEIVHLLLALARHFKAPVKFPPSVCVAAVQVQRVQGQLMQRHFEVELTDDCATYAACGTLKPTKAKIKDANNNNNNNYYLASKQRDAFDTLMDYAPSDKICIVQQSLVNFVNRHLSKVNINLQQPHQRSDNNQILNADEFSDGILLVLLISSLEEYFVPLGNLFTSASRQSEASQLAVSQRQTAIEPTSYVNTVPLNKLHNVNLAFRLIEDAGIVLRDRVRPEDIVNGDLKSVLRVLYLIFSRYKHL